ncbi:MAG: AAA family ATPase, partial [Gemmatimonas sp.]
MTIAPPAAVAPIHTAFARFVSRTAASPQNGLVYHSALLASAERAEGNSCVDLSVHATRPALPGDDGEVVFPPLPEWQTRLLASGVCAASDQPAHGYAVTPLVLDGPRLYLRRYFDAERRLAAAIQARVSAPPPAHLAASAPQFRTLFPQASAGLDWQAVAAVAALRSSLVFVTGGPGTGKTTVAARLLALLLDRDPTLDIAVAAPTGRAAARLTEAIGAAVQR